MMSGAVKQVLLPDGSYIPQIGQGTWQMGEDDSNLEREREGLQYGISLGMKLIDTAEMYAAGKSESIVGDVIKSFRREDIYIVDKVVPANANKQHMYSSVIRSLKLLGTDYIDIYLLHFRKMADLAEVAYLMEDLKAKGLIRRWGVSNFDVADMDELWKVPGGNKCCINQILYNLGARGIEYDLLQWQRAHKVPLMAYCPIGQAGDLVTQAGVSKAAIMKDKNVIELAKRRGISIVQLLLSFALQYDDMVAIPKAVGKAHIDENFAARDIRLTEGDLALLSESFPSPTEKVNMEKY